jgi:hypothetical protein
VILNLGAAEAPCPVCLINRVIGISSAIFMLDQGLLVPRANEESAGVGPSRSENSALALAAAYAMSCATRSED